MRVRERHEGRKSERKRGKEREEIERKRGMERKAR